MITDYHAKFLHTNSVVWAGRAWTGWDVTSTDARGNCRFIEVKAWRKDATTVTVNKNEMLVGFNKRGESWYLALVFVDGDTVDGPQYIPAPFDREPGWAETSVNLSVPDLLKRVASIQCDPEAVTIPPQA